MEAKFLVGVLFLLLSGSPDVYARNVATIWTPNSDDATGYRMYVKEIGTPDWQYTIDIPGRETAAYSVELPYGTEFDLALTATIVEENLESIKTATVFVPADWGTPILNQPIDFKKE